MTIPALCSFFLQLRDELKNRLKSHFKGSIKDEDRTTSTISIRKHKESSYIFEVSLEKQLHAWKENPIWEDQSPDIKVTVPKGSLSNLNLKVDVGLPPDAVYNILIDPANTRVFKNIKEVISRRVLVDEGARQLVELEQAALWRFLWWSGTISVHVLVDQNREDYSHYSSQLLFIAALFIVGTVQRSYCSSQSLFIATKLMKFKQVRTGFMKRFEGCWKVEPVLLDEKLCHPFKPKTVEDYTSYTKGKGRVGSKLSLEQIIEPAMVPPPPISWYLRGITTRTTEMLINDLIAETARIRGVSDTENSGEHGIYEKIFDTCQVDEFSDIKERWTMRRRIARQCHRRLPSTVKSRT